MTTNSTTLTESSSSTTAFKSTVNTKTTYFASNSNKNTNISMMSLFNSTTHSQLTIEQILLTTKQVANKPTNPLLAMDSNQLCNLLKNYSGDLGNCLSNCSNKGFCELDSNLKYICKCNELRAGYSCEYSLNKCETGFCANNGICTISNLTNQFTYECKCPRNFYGKRCEYKSNTCENETCSHNGYCYDNSSKIACKCFKLYFGEKCENQDANLKLKKTLIKTTSIVAIILIILYVLTIFLLDISDIFFCKMKVKKRKGRFKF